MAPNIPGNIIAFGMIDSEALKELLKAESPSNEVGKLCETALTVDFYAPTPPVL